MSIPRWGVGQTAQRSVIVAGRSESWVDERAQPIYQPWSTASPAVETTILASLGQVELHLTAHGPELPPLAAQLDGAVAELAAALGDDVVSLEGRNLEQTVGDLLRDRGWMVAVAESCTGGLVAARLTDVAGSSAYVERGVVAYSNDAKVADLDVPAALIEAHGAVSEPVAVAMAEGLRRRAGVAVGLGRHRRGRAGRRHAGEAGGHGLPGRGRSARPRRSHGEIHRRTGGHPVPGRLGRPRPAAALSAGRGEGVMLAGAGLGYLIGSLPLGYLLARRWAGVDLRRVGSGNVGATNVLRVSGPSLGGLVMAVDMGKGLAAVALAGRVSPTAEASVAAGVAAVVGHMFPIWLGGRGGKGVATACGAFALLAPVATVAAAAVFLTTVWSTRLVSLGSVAATATLPVAAAASGSPAAVVNGATLAAAAVVWRHRGNLQRLWRGRERRLGQASGRDPRA